MSELISNLNTIESVKLDIKSAIEAKGVSMSGVSFPDYANKISEIPVGGTMSQLSVLSNGTYTPPTGIDGWDRVTVDVPQSVSGYTLSDVIENKTSQYLYDSTVTYIPCGGLIGGKWFYFTGGTRWSGKGLSELLISVDFPACSTVQMYGFYYQSLLQTVYLSSCEQIGDYAFASCSSLSQISIYSCTHIGNSAFQLCSSLSQISLPYCTAIGNSAFQGCNSLSQISLPYCTVIGSNAFNGCTSLSMINLTICNIIYNSAFNACNILSELILGSTSVCSLNNLNVFAKTPIAAGTGSIYVPASLVDAYKSAKNWSAYSSRIFPIE